MTICFSRLKNAHHENNNGKIMSKVDRQRPDILCPDNRLYACVKMAINFIQYIVTCCLASIQTVRIINLNWDIQSMLPRKQKGQSPLITKKFPPHQQSVTRVEIYELICRCLEKTYALLSHLIDSYHIATLELHKATNSASAELTALVGHDFNLLVGDITSDKVVDIGWHTDRVEERSMAWMPASAASRSLIPMVSTPMTLRAKRAKRGIFSERV